MQGWCTNEPANVQTNNLPIVLGLACNTALSILLRKAASHSHNRTPTTLPPCPHHPYHSLYPNPASRQEVSILWKINHPNIVQFFGCALGGGQGFLLMELMAGGDLEHALRADAATSGRRELDWYNQ